ncbi:MAG: two-component regulator propeller domain-containing protein [Cyclobacteriaceae bacterium]|jgi:ligand-binding sensor domain-containing protein|nr:hypothetical protein [Flammeovirgaceae bacterium]
MIRIIGSTLFFVFLISKIGYAQTGWTTFNTKNSPLLDNRIPHLAVDHNNNIWGAYAGAGGDGNGILRYDGKNFTNYTKSNSGLPNNDIRVIKVDSKGNIWFACYNAGIAMFNGTTWKTYNTSNSNIVGNLIVDIEFDADGNLWVGDYFKGVSKYDGIQWTSYDRSKAPFPESNCINDLEIDKDNNVWVGLGCAGGMAKFTQASGKWSSYTLSNSAIPDHTVNNLLIDPNGIIWASHINLNVSSFNGTTWTKYPEKREIDQFMIDKAGKLWGAGFGLYTFNDGKWEGRPLPAAADTSYAFSLVFTDSHAWLSTYSGLWIDRLNTSPAFELEPITLDQDFEPLKRQVKPAAVPEDEQWQKVKYTIVNSNAQKINATIHELTGEITLKSVPLSTGSASLTIIANDGQVENNLFEVTMRL